MQTSSYSIVTLHRFAEWIFRSRYLPWT